MNKCIFCQQKTKETVGITPTSFARTIIFSVCKSCMEEIPIIKLFKLADGMIREQFAQEGYPIEY